MSTKELKEEIQKIIDTVPENVLEDVLEYLKSILTVAPENIKDIHNLRQILQEDKELLEKLAK